MLSFKTFKKLSYCEQTSVNDRGKHTSFHEILRVLSKQLLSRPVFQCLHKQFNKLVYKKT